MSTDFARILPLLVVTTCLSACGKSGPVTIVAKNTDPAFAKIGALDSAPSSEALAPPASFKICVKKVSFEDESGEDQGNGSSDDAETEEEKNEINFSVGEVDLSDLASSDVTIGTIADAPVGFRISKVKLKLKKFGSCTHSIEYGAKTTNADVEFRFRFNPPVELDSNSTLDVYFSEIASVIATAGTIDHGSFRSAIQQVQASARKR